MEQLHDDVASSSDLKFCGKTFGWVIYSRRFKRHQINAKPIFLASTLIYMIINVMPIIILQKDTKLLISQILSLRRIQMCFHMLCAYPN